MPVLFKTDVAVLRFQALCVPKGAQIQDFIEKSWFKKAKYVVLPHVLAGLEVVGLSSHDQSWLREVPWRGAGGLLVLAWGVLGAVF